MKRRRLITTRWTKMTDIAFSSTVNASELKNSIVTSSTQPITPRCSTKRASSRDHGGRLARNQPFEIARQRVEQLVLVDDAGEHDQHQDQHRHDRQQRVVRHGARKQQALIRAKRAHGAQHECPGIGHRERGLLAETPA